ncbi:MAG: FHA domain-containing protein [Actinobacteria bacterium]|nr:FHA domain-containing protein [Actinomycetota bacterium]
MEDFATSVGRAESNHVALDDERVSRQHAIIQRTGVAGWRITDLDSTNGTFVNDQRIRADRPLRDRDRIRLGDAELVFCTEARSPETQRRTVVGPLSAPPHVTRRERDVLVALCRPLFTNDRFPRPATTREICAELVITESAVRHHLDRLYDKFEIYDDDADERRRHLATDAIRRGVVVEADALRDGHDERRA